MKKSVLFSLLAVFLFSSCSNFLSGSFLKEELEAQIDYANAKAVSVLISSDNKNGETTPSGQIIMKLGYPVEINYKEVPSYVFYKWIAVNNSTEELCADGVTFEDPFSLTTTVTINSEVKNLRIKPLCFERLAVISHGPASGTNLEYANNPIKVQFNYPVYSKYIDFSNISILSAGEDVSQLFESPVLSSDGKTLTISPKPLEIIDFITANNSAFIEVQVILSKEITGNSNGLESSLLQNDDSNWTFRYKPQTELNPPEQFAFAVSKKIPQSNLATSIAVSDLIGLKDFDNFETEDYSINHIKDTVYITARYFDGESGVDLITVDEVRTNGVDASEVIRNPELSEYDFTTTYSVSGSENKLNIIQDENGYAIIAIPYKLKSVSDGAVKLSVRPVDACGNIGESQEFTVIKDTSADLSNLTPYNYDNLQYIQTNNNAFTAKDNTLSQYKPSFDKVEFLKQIKRIKIDIDSEKGINRKFYGNYEEDFSDLTVDFDYKTISGRTGSLDFTKNQDYFYYDFDLDDISGLSFKITVTDTVGNKNSRSFVIPAKPELMESSLAKNSDGSINKNGLSYMFIKENPDAQYMYVVIDDSIKYGTIFGQCNSTGASYLQGDVLDYDHFWFFENNSLFSGFSEIFNSGFDNHEIVETVSFQAPKIIKQVLSKGEEKYIDITFVVDAAEWQKFDDLYIQWTEGIRRRKYYGKEKTELTISFPLLSGAGVTDLWNNNLEITLVGVKEMQKRTARYTIKAIKNEENCYLYDTICPKFSMGGSSSESSSEFTQYNFIKNAYDEYFIPVVNVKDDETSVEKIELTFNGKTMDFTMDDLEKDYEATVTNALGNKTDDITCENVLKLPVWDLTGPVYFTIKVTDKGGNSTTKETVYVFDSLPGFEPVLTGTEVFTKTYNLRAPVKAEFSNAQAFVEQLFIWDEENGNWNEPVEITTQEEKKDNYFTIKNVEIETNKWVRVLGEARTQRFYTTPFFHYTPSTYFYTGEPSSAEEDAVLFFDNGLLVYSDQPVFVHTLVTDSPHEECKDWTVEQWEYHHKRLNEKVLDMSKGSKFYLFDMDEIEENQCYLAVVYFANGVAKLTNIRQK